MADATQNPLVKLGTLFKAFFTPAGRSGMPLTQQLGWQGYSQWLRTRSPQPPAGLPGPTEAEIVAADLRLRKALARQAGRSASVVTGGLGDQGLRLTLPTLIGTREGA